MHHIDTNYKNVKSLFIVFHEWTFENRPSGIAWLGFGWNEYKWKYKLCLEHQSREGIRDNYIQIVC